MTDFCVFLNIRDLDITLGHISLEGQPYDVFDIRPSRIEMTYHIHV